MALAKMAAVNGLGCMACGGPAKLSKAGAIKSWRNAAKISAASA